MKKKGIVEGVGINDVDNVQKFEIINGKNKLIWCCPFYRSWKHMLKRCYNKKYKDLHGTYEGCYVCEEWLTFSNFKSWMEQQDWEGKQLDKDLLVYKNKVYSPETCVFLPQELNKFLTKSNKARGEYPLGVWKRKPSKGMKNNYLNSYVAACGDGEGGQKYLGVFYTPEDAHKAWQKSKASVAFQLSVKQEDTYIKAGLFRVYMKILEDLKEGRETFDF